MNKIRLLNRNKKKIYQRVKKWNSLYERNELDFYKAALSLSSWIGHAGLGDNYQYIKKIKSKCKWYYIEGDLQC